MSEYENKTMRTLESDMSQSMPQVNAEAQVANAIVGLLNEQAQHVNADVAARLSTARGQAVNQLAERQRQGASYHGVNHSGNVLQLFGGHVGQYLGHHRFMSFMLVGAAILIAFFAAEQFGFNNNLEHSDAFLLASDLPPEAYADKGFDTWLDTTAD